MKKEIKERNSWIELLRMLAMCGVVILHYNHPSMGGAFTFAPKFTLNSYVLYFFECVFVCAVNAFLIVSGYYMSTQKKCNIWKMLRLLMEVVVIREVVYLIYVALGMKVFSWKVVLIYLLPANYYVVLYVAMSLLAPFINVFLDGLNVKNFRKFLVLATILFAIWPTMVDIMVELSGNSLTGLNTVSMYGSQYGYCIVNFVFMYIIGAAIRRKVIKFNTITSIISLVVCWGLLFIWSQIAIYKNWGTAITLSYCNPLVIMSAISVFFIFANRKPFNNKVINVLSKGSFMVYLLHLTFFRRSQIQNAVQNNAFYMIAHMLLTSVCIYLICWVVSIVYGLLEKLIFGLLEKKLPLSISCKSNDEK